MATDCGAGVRIDGEPHFRVYSSSDWAERGFCSHGGTHLFYRLRDSGQYIIPVGLFTDMESPQFEGQLFIDEKPGFYEFSNQMEMLTGEQVFAKFLDPESS